MKLEILPHDFTVCQVADYSMTDWSAEFCFAGKTDEECSLVCRTEDVPAKVIRREDGWKAFRIVGTLDFSLVGILAKISAVLAGHQIGIFAVSTYNTDYILTKAENFPKALAVLAAEGYAVLEK